MHIINKAVSLMESQLEDCGISDNPVVLSQEEEVTRCQYERGALIRVTFGGRSAGIASDFPVRTTTKPSFMFGAPLNKPELKAAATGILNVLTGFLCRSRVLHACTPDHHGACGAELAALLKGKKLWCCGEMPLIREQLAQHLVEKPDDADFILVSADGMVDRDGGIIPEQPGEQVLFIGPSAAGVATLTHGCHFCPYGRMNL
jgi:hypothetical protein